MALELSGRPSEAFLELGATEDEAAMSEESPKTRKPFPFPSAALDGRSSS